MLKFKMPSRLTFVKWLGLVLTAIGVAVIFSGKNIDHTVDVGAEYTHVGLAFWVVAMVAQGIVDELRRPM